MAIHIRRREFVVTLGGAAAAWPLATRGQENAGMRRVGTLLPTPEDDKVGQSWLTAFREGLHALGWIDGRNVQIESRFTAGDVERMRNFATELAELRPDVILVAGTLVVGETRPLLRSFPVVFVQVTDPVGTGFVESLAHPAGNMTGFTSFEYSFGGKWLELLKELQPTITHVAVVEHADNSNRTGYLRAIESAASALRIEVIAPDVRHVTDFEGAFANLARKPGIGLIVPPDTFTFAHRGALVALATRHRLPSVYAFPPFVVDGGLMCYSVDNKDMYHRAASYVDRILHGERPGDLPVQASNKFQLMLNLKAARAIGVDVPSMLLARADEVIE